MNKRERGHIELPLHQLLEGDLLFKVGGNALSDLVLELDGDFSHVGMVVLSGKEAKVVHATPPVAGNGGVVVESVESYLRDARRVAWARLQGIDKTTRQKLQTFALSQLGKPFDFDFSLQDPKKLYCSELVIRAWESVSAPTYTHAVTLPFFPEPIVPPRALLNNQLQILKMIGY